MWLNVLRDPTDSSTLPNPKPKDSESNAEKLPHFSASLSSFPPVENEPPTTTPFHMSWMTGTVAIKYAVNLGGWVGRGCVHLYLCKEQTAEKWFFFFLPRECGSEAIFYSTTLSNIRPHTLPFSTPPLPAMPYGAQGSCLRVPLMIYATGTVNACHRIGWEPFSGRSGNLLGNDRQAFIDCRANCCSGEGIS